MRAYREVLCSNPQPRRAPEYKNMEGQIISCQDHDQVRQTAKLRRASVRSWMEEQKTDGLLIGRRDHFAWLTCGGNNAVIRDSEWGSAYLLITPQRRYLLAHPMDSARMMQEDLPGQGYQEAVVNRAGSFWRQAQRLAPGRIFSDGCFSGHCPTVDLSSLHQGLEPVERDRIRWLGHTTALVFEELAKHLARGVSEQEIARWLHSSLILNGIEPSVIITGSEGRLEQYWHPLASPKQVRQYALIHAASMRWGLHACVNRTVCFGPPPPSLRERHSKSISIQETILSLLREGIPYKEIQDRQRRRFAALGLRADWKGHFHGGMTGYCIGDGDRWKTDMTVKRNQAFDWFVTVGGVQTEELVLLTGQGLEIPSLGIGWPKTTIAVNGQPAQFPGLYILPHT